MSAKVKASMSDLKERFVATGATVSRSEREGVQPSQSKGGRTVSGRDVGKARRQKVTLYVDGRLVKALRIAAARAGCDMSDYVEIGIQKVPEVMKEME